MNLFIDAIGAIVGLAFALIALSAATDWIGRVVIH